MRIIVAGDTQPLSTNIRQQLHIRGYEDSSTHLVPLAKAVDSTVQIRPDVLVLVASRQSSTDIKRVARS